MSVRVLAWIRCDPTTVAEAVRLAVSGSEPPAVAALKESADAVRLRADEAPRDFPTEAEAEALSVRERAVSNGPPELAARMMTAAPAL